MRYVAVHVRCDECDFEQTFEVLLEPSGHLDHTGFEVEIENAGWGKSRPDGYKDFCENCIKSARD